MTIARSEFTRRAACRWCVSCALAALLLASCGGSGTDAVPTATSGGSADTRGGAVGTTSTTGARDTRPDPADEPVTVPTEPTSSASDQVDPVDAPGRRLTAADDGGTFSLAVDETAELTVPDGEPAPTVDGDAILVIRTTEFAGDGRPVYEVRAVAPGRATIVGDGWRIILIVT